jgi:hypothetical protein
MANFGHLLNKGCEMEIPNYQMPGTIANVLKHDQRNLQYNSLPEVVSTSQAAKVLNRAEQTLRRWACQENAPSGIRPIRINRRLAWRVVDLNRLLMGEGDGESGATGSRSIVSERIDGGINHALS